jgi:hypothetical protein
MDIDVPSGIITHVTRELSGNMHDRHIVDVTSGSFQKERQQPYGGILAKYATALENGTSSRSAHRCGDIMHTRNNRVCYDFKEKRLVPAHYTIHPYWGDSGGFHLKS